MHTFVHTVPPHDKHQKSQYHDIGLSYASNAHFCSHSFPNFCPVPFRQVLTYEEAINAVKEEHDTFHDCRNRLMPKLGDLYQIYRLQDKVDDCISRCLTCLKKNKGTSVPPVQPIISSYPGERLVGDLTKMPFPDSETGEVYIFLIVDHFTKFLWACPLQDKDAESIAHVYHDVLQELEHLETTEQAIQLMIHTDNGREFVNQVVERVARQHTARRITGAPYHPQSQGVVERKNQTVKGKLIALCDDQHTWSKHVPDVVMNENNAVCDTTGTRPHLILKGFDHDSRAGGHQDKLTPIELQLVRAKAKAKMLGRAVKVMSKTDNTVTTFIVGEYVLVKTRREKERRLKKLLEPHYGTMAIIHEVEPGHRYKIKWIDDPKNQSLGLPGSISRRMWTVDELKKIKQTGTHVKNEENEKTEVKHEVCLLTDNTYGQQFYNNGSCACFLNVSLVLGSLLRHHLYSTGNQEGFIETLTPLAKEFFQVCEPWLPGSAKSVNTPHFIQAFARRNARRQTFRASIVARFMGGKGMIGEYGTPWGVLQALGDHKYCDVLSTFKHKVQAFERTSEIKTIPLPTKEEALSTRTFLYMPGTILVRCNECYHVQKKEHRTFVTFDGVSSLKRSTHERRLQEVVQDLVDYKITYRKKCTQKVTTESASLKGHFARERCPGHLSFLSSTTMSGPMFGLPVSVGNTNTGTFPDLDLNITLNLSDGTHAYRVVAIINFIQGNHFEIVMFDGKFWWHYDDLKNNHCTIRVPAPSTLNNVHCIWFMKVTPKKKAPQKRTPQKKAPQKKTPEKTSRRGGGGDSDGGGHGGGCSSGPPGYSVAQVAQKRATPQKRTPQKKDPQKKTPQKKTPQKRTPHKKTPEKKASQTRTPQKRTPRRGGGSDNDGGGHGGGCSSGPPGSSVAQKRASSGSNPQPRRRQKLTSGLFKKAAK